MILYLKKINKNINLSFINKKKIIKNKNINLYIKKNLNNYYFIKFFLIDNYQLLSRNYTKLKKTTHNLINKSILHLRQKKILPYSL